MTANILNIILVFFVLVGMVMVLAGMRHLFSSENQEHEADALDREVREEDDVISSHNLFHSFLSPGRRAIDSGESARLGGKE